MAENTGEERLDNAADPQSKNPPDKIIPTIDIGTRNSNQEIENMEIHAQELHKAPGHGFKHYLFEFLISAARALTTRVLQFDAVPWEHN